MNLHEYQAKEIFKEYGIPVPEGEVAWNLDEAIAIFDNFGSKHCVAKAQVHAGGRGKAGGVSIINSKEELTQFAQKFLGQRLVTYQTDDNGQPVNQILLEETCEITRELYLGAVVDRTKRRVVFMASTEGGVEIEKVAQESPEKILTIVIDPMFGALPYQCRQLAFDLGLKNQQIRQFTQILTQLARLFVEKDLALLEVNPLVINDDDELVCLDAKINLDSNALFRQPKTRELRDTTQEDERENRALDWDLSYIALDGDIGCMVNGAGLAMATMDLVKLHGGNPANFLDVGGGATKERVAEAFRIILSDLNVRAVLVNIFGGIVRCDLIAEGIIGAVAEEHVEVPVVVRLEGNNAEMGSKMLADSGLNIIAAESLTDAAKKVVKAVESA